MKDYLIKNYKYKTKKQMADELGVSFNKIEWELKKLGLRKFKNKKYSDEEVQFLIENYPVYGATYCADKLNRSFSAVCKKAESLGLSINRAYQYISSQGYIVLCKNRSNKKLLHRKIMEEHLGRKLSSNEIVHHIDGNKLNNDISNLKIVSRSEHMKIHFYNKQ